MTFLELSREARRRPIALALVALAAVLVGLFVAFQPGLPPQSRAYEVWHSSTDVLVDTSNSEVFEPRNPDFGTLASRTSLLGYLVATRPMRAAIAAASGVEPERLVLVPPTAPLGAGSVPAAPATVEGKPESDAEATTLTLTTDSVLPILHVTAQAPDATTAQSIAQATVQQLRRHVDSVGARDEVPAAKRLVVQQLAAVTTVAETRGPTPFRGIVAAIFVALLGWATVGGVPLIARRLRNAAPGAGGDAQGLTGEAHAERVPLIARRLRNAAPGANGDAQGLTGEAQAEGRSVADRPAAIEWPPAQTSARGARLR